MLPAMAEKAALWDNEELADLEHPSMGEGDKAGELHLPPW